MKRRLDFSDQIEQASPKKQRITRDNEEPNLFDLLPIELVKQICDYLNVHERRYVRLVSQRILSIINITHFDLGMVFDAEVDKIISVFGRYRHPIGLNIKKPRKLFDNAHKLSKLTNLKALTLAHVIAGSLDLSQMTNLESIHLEQVNITPAWSKMTNLTSLRAHTLEHNHNLPTSLIELGFTSRCRFDMTKVYSNMTALYCPDIFDDMDIIRSIMPNLKRATLRASKPPLENIRPGLTALENLTTNIGLTDLNASILTALHIESKSFNWSYFTHLTNLKVLKLAEVVKDFQLTTLRQLEYLQIINCDLNFDVYLDQISLLPTIASKLTCFQGLHSNQLEFNTICKLTSLEVLELKHITRGPLNVDLDLAATSNLCQLTSLKLGKPTSISNANAINRLFQLVKLELASYQHIDPQQISLVNLSRLTFLSVSMNRHIELYSETSYPRPLQYLQLDFATFEPSHLIAFTNLTCLKTDVPFDWQLITRLTKLQELNLETGNYPNSITMLGALAQLSSLTYRTSDSSTSSLYYLSCLTRLRIVKRNRVETVIQNKR